jgi:alkylation response protein AidB-like acyl-CoA dehydrogenase
MTTDTVLNPSPETVALREKTAQFMEEFIYPNEQLLEKGDDEADALVKRLQGIAKERGLWAPHLPKETGGMGIPFLTYAYMSEVIGRSLQAPSAFGAQAPDSGNAEILWQFGTPEQKEKWLKPLVNGDIKSCYSMTEPDVSSSDATQLATEARLDGDEWVISGRKWFTSNGNKAQFALVMAKTDPDAAPHNAFSMLIVPTDTPGFEIERLVAVWGHEDSPHPIVRYNDVRVPATNVLGPRGWGFKLSQKRLGPGRIHHCMRALGQASRAFDLMCQRALNRQAFGSPLAEKQTIQTWIADSFAEIQAARLLTMQAAQKIDQGDEARLEVSLIKFFTVNAALNVIDRSIQVHGALGFTSDTPLQGMFKIMRILRVADGPDEVHRMVVARRVLREYRAGNTWDFSNF